MLRMVPMVWWDRPLGSAASQFVSMSMMPMAPVLGGLLLERYGGGPAVAALALATDQRVDTSV